jgi:hypothetical protein
MPGAVLCKIAKQATMAKNGEVQGADLASV